MEPRSDKDMGIRLALFMFLALGLFLLNRSWIASNQQEQALQQAEEAAQAEGEQAQEPDPKPSSDEEPADPADPAEPVPAEQPDVAPAVKHPDRVLTLGSADPNSESRMLVTVISQGAAVARIELNDPKYRTLQDEEGLAYQGGYLGQLTVAPTTDEDDLADPTQVGSLVEVVGPGTPAALAGLRAGDRILKLDEAEIEDARSLKKELEKTKPGQTVRLTVARQVEPNPLELEATLSHRPMEILRPENGDPLSFLMTLQRIDEEEIHVKTEDELEDEKAELKAIRKAKEVAPCDPTVDWEIDGVKLRTANWEVVEEERTDLQVAFRMELPKWGLEVRKTYRLAADDITVSAEGPSPSNYHLTLDVAVRNTGSVEREVAYRLDGPTGLPTEGKWYANKIGPGWGLYGMRDVLYGFGNSAPTVVQCTQIASADVEEGSWKEEDGGPYLTCAGVDALYFSVVMIPQRNESDDEPWFSDGQPIRVGGVVNEIWKGKLTNTSFRLTSVERTLQPGEELAHSYTVFAGPKKPVLLDEYGLGETISYGWFSFIARPMLWTLHFFHGLLGNYGVAILMLTVLVRACMFPISRKQAINAQKMQEVQPEMKKLAEKYKDDMQARGKAQQELYAKHNFHPAHSCLPLFLQLPIFIGLYRSLSVDVELRGAPLLSESIRWCSNLAAPDMLYDWSGFWEGIGWGAFNAGQWIFYLGPYFNVLPLVTMALMFFQQKMFMPPPTDDQAIMQRKMMNFMMIFMGFIFFKVASGLCIYFIASSAWGMAERKFLPKPKEGGSGSPAKPSPPKPRPADRPKPRPSSSGGAAASKKRKNVRKVKKGKGRKYRGQ